MIQSLEDRFLNWRLDIEKKQEEQARQMKELKECVELLPHENDCLLTQVEKKRYLDKRAAQDSGQAQHPVFRDKGKNPIVLDDVDIPEDDELSSDNLPDPSPIKGNKDRSRKRHSHRLTFSNSNNDLFRRAMGRGHNRPNEAPGSVFTLPTDAILPMQSVYPAFGTGLTFYVSPTTAIRSPNDILSSPLGQHIIDYEPPLGFMMPTFAMFNGFGDPYDTCFIIIRQ